MVPRRGGDEEEWTVVRDEALAEEVRGSRVALGHRPPEALAAHLFPRAGKTVDPTLRMLLAGLADDCGDPEPVPDEPDVAERDARLRHSPRPGIHAEVQLALLR